MKREPAFRPPSPSAKSASASLRICLCGGGTGGHVYPALAVAQALQSQTSANFGSIPSATVSQDANDLKLNNREAPKTANTKSAPEAGNCAQESLEIDLLYVGSIGGMEAQLVQRESNLAFRALPAAALRGRGPVALFRGIITLGNGTKAAFDLLRETRPAVILGTGGYVCVPLFFAARLLKIPTLIYLPDLVPGLAVRLLAKLATQVACSVEDSLKYFSPRTPKSVTGYPVRAELFTQEKSVCRAAFGLQADLPVLLVYGGSRGARSINRAIEALLPDLIAFTQILHICGREGDEVWLQEARKRLPVELQARYKLYPYLENTSPTMVQAFGAADLAVCRSGASTLAELPAAGLPAILVPYPYVHQDENAAYLVNHAAALKIADAAMLGLEQPQKGPLFTQIQHLLRDASARHQMALNCRQLARPDAAQHLAETLLNLARKRQEAL